MMDKRCANCICLSDGFGDDERGSGWCYSNEDYRDFTDSCPFWTGSLRDEPVNEPEARLVEAVKAKDCEVED